jgi:hypothetical protein
MIKKLLTGLNLFVFIAVFSQVGIGTHTPEGALDITSPNNVWGLVLPHVDQAENTKNPARENVKKGTIVYDLKQNCIRYFDGDKWSGCLLAPIPNPFKLECSSVGLSKDIIVNFPIVDGTTVSIPYSNTGEAFDYEKITILSSSVAGITAVLPSGSIKKGSGNLVFSISGTPSTYGEVKFSLSIAGVYCEFVITAKNYTDIEVPVMTNFTCGLKDQLSYTNLKGKHIINGKEVAVDYSGSNINYYPKSTSCNVVVIENNFYLGKGNGSSTLKITFSRPVTNVGIAFTGADSGEVFTFIINNNQPIELKGNSSCQENIKIIDNKSNINTVETTGGNITVGGKWFTELTIKHNGEGGGALFGFCLNNSNVL